MAELELVDRQQDLFLLLRKPAAPAGRSLAIFIHGFLGDHVTTWGRLPEMLRENAPSEPLLDSWDFLFLGYSTRQIVSYLDIAHIIATQWTVAAAGKVHGRIYAIRPPWPLLGNARHPPVALCWRDAAAANA